MSYCDSEFMNLIIDHIDSLSYEETIFLKGCLYAMYPPVKDVNPFTYKMFEYLSSKNEREVKNVN